MAEIIAATAGEMLGQLASAEAQATGQSYADWAAQEAFKRVVDQTTPGVADPPIYRWDYTPEAEEAFSKIVDETSADGAWQAWKEGGGKVSSGGNAAPSPTVKTSPQTAMKKAGAAGASAGGLLSMSLPTWVAAAAPLIGVSVGVGLYKLNPELWTKISQTLLPWAYEDSEAMPVVTDEDGNTYIDKDAVEALKQLFEEEGIGEAGHATSEDFPGVSVPVSGSAIYSSGEHTLSATGATFVNNNGSIIACSASPGTFTYEAWTMPGPEVHQYTASMERTYTIDGKTVYYDGVGAVHDAVSSPGAVSGSINDGIAAWIAIFGTIIGGQYPEGTSQWTGDAVDIGSLPVSKVYTDPEDDTKTRDFIPVALPTTPGQSLDPDENPDPTTNEDPERQIQPYILPNIPKDQYPEGSDDDTLSDGAPIPSPLPNPNPKPDTDADPSQPSDEKPSKIVDLIPPFDTGVSVPIPSNPTTPGDGSTDGGVGGLVSVYNPTYAELQAFSQWLWVTYADATIDKIWNNPFDGIISLHELYATPSTGAKKYIKSGFLVSPVECYTVPERYTEINCGTAIFPEYYGNYLDYSPYSKALVYLPFIGIMELNVDDIVGHAVNITYHVDSYSGACIALLECAKEGEDAVLYQFNGNCSVQCPIAGGSQAAIKAAQLTAGAYQNAYHVAGVAGLAGGLASSVGSLFTANIGGVLGGLVSGIGSYASNQARGNAAAISQTVSAKSSVQHSGQFGESYGAMGCKNPYIIIKHPVQVRVTNYQDEYGYPAHKYVNIGECEGYIRCRGVHINSARATDAEKQAIEQALMEGVYVT